MIPKQHSIVVYCPYFVRVHVVSMSYSAWQELHIRDSSANHGGEEVLVIGIGRAICRKCAI